MKLNCPNCRQNLKVPENAAGRQIVCPACKKSLFVPVAAALAAPTAPVVPVAATADAAKPSVDDLALQPVHEEPVPAQDAAQPVFCPHCGAKWQPGTVVCAHCQYNSVFMRQVKLTKPRRFSLWINVQTIVFLAVLAGLVFGCWWLFNNWNSVKRQGMELIDKNTRKDESETR